MDWVWCISPFSRRLVLISTPAVKGLKATGLKCHIDLCYSNTLYSRRPRDLFNRNLAIGLFFERNSIFWICCSFCFPSGLEGAWRGMSHLQEIKLVKLEWQRTSHLKSAHQWGGGSSVEALAWETLATSRTVVDDSFWFISRLYNSWHWCYCKSKHGQKLGLDLSVPLRPCDVVSWAELCHRSTERWQEKSDSAQILKKRPKSVNMDTLVNVLH